jgi:hypothetical protein
VRLLRLLRVLLGLLVRLLRLLRVLLGLLVRLLRLLRVLGRLLVGLLRFLRMLLRQLVGLLRLLRVLGRLLVRLFRLLRMLLRQLMRLLRLLRVLLRLLLRLLCLLRMLGCLLVRLLRLLRVLLRLLPKLLRFLRVLLGLLVQLLRLLRALLRLLVGLLRLLRVLGRQVVGLLRLACVLHRLLLRSLRAAQLLLGELMRLLRHLRMLLRELKAPQHVAADGLPFRAELFRLLMDGPDQLHLAERLFPERDDLPPDLGGLRHQLLGHGLGVVGAFMSRRARLHSRHRHSVCEGDPAVVRRNRGHDFRQLFGSDWRGLLHGLCRRGRHGHRLRRRRRRFDEGQLRQPERGCVLLWRRDEHRRLQRHGRSRSRLGRGLRQGSELHELLQTLRGRERRWWMEIFHEGHPVCVGSG